jgi:hypothetical protein
MQYTTNKDNMTNIVMGLKDYMFTSDNLMRFTKHMIQHDIIPKCSLKNIDKNELHTSKIESIDIDAKKIDVKSNKRPDTKTSEVKRQASLESPVKPTKKPRMEEKIYKPRQKDSLFWCLYILKNGYFKYEMEIINQYFVVEKTEKFKYIEMLRKNKDLIKLHKIKPFTELENDLANKDKISIKTFFALCILENINVLLVDKRKVYEITCIDIDETHPVNVIHRNSQTYEHFIELNSSPDILQKYRDTYYKMETFDSTLKAIGSYKVDELIDLCKKLDINIDKNDSNDEDHKKKKTKKDIYELLVLNY